MESVYFKHPDFGLSSLTGVEPKAPKGSTEMTKEQFDDEIQSMEEARSKAASDRIEKERADRIEAFKDAGFTSAQIALLT